MNSGEQRHFAPFARPSAETVAPVAPNGSTRKPVEPAFPGHLETADIAGPAVWDSGSVAAHIVTLGSATALCAVFNTALIFVVPKIVGVEDYGYWRLFLLYASYTGMLHLGFVDGAFVTWAGKPLEAFHHQIAPSIKFVVWEGLAVLPLVGAAVLFVGDPNVRFVAVAVVAVALILNLVSLLQVSLQAARKFGPVAVSTAVPLGLFLLLVVTLALAVRRPGYIELLVLYMAAWIATLVWLGGRVKPWKGGKQCTENLGTRFLSAGWPIMLGNASFAFAQQADRFAVSWATDIRDFAVYSLAASAVAVPVLATQAVYKVLLPHLASVDRGSRAQIYRQASRVLLLAWIVFLPYYFLLEMFITKFLPSYGRSLPIARVLLLGIIFLAVVQILHMSFSYVHGKQRDFLSRTVAVLFAGLGLAVLAVTIAHSLVAVSAAEVITLGAWWLFNEWRMREMTGQRFHDWARFLGVAMLAGTGYWFAASYGRTPAAGLGLYCAWAAVIACVTSMQELKVAIGLVNRAVHAGGVGRR